jgi:SPP1 gp7 family putative phage head morphogenesis protein
MVLAGTQKMMRNKNNEAHFAINPRDPDIVRSAKRLRTQIITRNDKALSEMQRVYWQAYRNLKHEFDEITKLIEKAIAEGKQAVLREAGSGAKLMEDQFSANWLFRQQRYKELMEQCEAEILRFSKTAANLTRKEQEWALELGDNHAHTLMRESLGAMPEELVRMGVRVRWNYINRDALLNMVGYLADGSPLDYKFAELAPEVSQAIKDTITTGLAKGQNPRRIAREIRRAYGDNLSNALLTCRTETMRAYREATFESYNANADIVKGWIWLAAKQPRTCAACWGMDGTFHELSERLVDHPAGRCTSIPVTRSWQELFPDKDLSNIKDTSAKPWDSTKYFDRLSEADQKRVLGVTKFRMYQAGEINLRDIPTLQRSRTWGNHYAPGNLQDVTARAQARKKQAA